jgi:hypothetical protein
MNKVSVWCAVAVAMVASLATRGVALEMINDSHFQTGFKVLQPTTGAVEGTLQYTTAYGAPQWELAQWASKQTINGTTPVSLGDGAYLWDNNYKSVVLGPTTTGYADVQLGVNSITEFNNVYRTSSQSFPGLLAQQSICTPGGWRYGTATSIADMTAANFNIDIKLVQADNVHRTGYNSSIHATQFPIYFTVQNLNPSSAGYGQYLWFGILTYDDRHSPTTLYHQIDTGTNSLIYSLGLNTFGKAQGPQVGTWMNISGDILPYMKAALQYAWANGILTASKDFADYRIGGMNIGWETPGLGDVNMQVKNLSLNVSLVPEPSTLALLSAGLVGLLAFVWRRRR